MAVSILCWGACGSRAREYLLRGQVMKIAAGNSELVVNHGDIPGFMPAMTMAYRVKDEAALRSLAPGDLISATLVVPDGEVPYLSAIKRTGHADVPEAPHVMDLLQPGDVVPDDALEDQDGVRRPLSDWTDRAVAVTFIYTRCPMPDFCPLMDRNFAAVQRAIAADAALKNSVHLVSVSFDPTHDTPAVLKAHAKRLGADPRIWSFVTGPPPVMSRFASRFGVSLIDDGSGPTITHNLRTAVIDRTGRLVKIYSGSEWRPETLVSDLRDASGR